MDIEFLEDEENTKKRRRVSLNEALSYAMRFLKWFGVVAVFLLLIFIVTLNVFAFVFNGEDDALNSYFSERGIPYKLERIDFEDTQLRFLQTGIEHDSASIILFIHGAPGNLDNFKSYLSDIDLRQGFKLIAMDRLGYGGSAYGESETSIARQAAAAAAVIRRNKARKVYVFSHSYGGPVSAKLTVDYPDLVDGLIMCAPLNDPYSEPMHWYSKLANWSISRSLMPAFIDVATDEKMTHAKELKKIEGDWAKINIPVLHVHGKNDRLAPFEENVNFSRKNINEDFLQIYISDKMGHLNIWVDAGTIKEKTLNFISQIEG
jgi:pimeloyl-ACP methyl ester carboxylesterase